VPPALRVRIFHQSGEADALALAILVTSQDIQMLLIDGDSMVEVILKHLVAGVPGVFELPGDLHHSGD